jgi:thymidylate kinase
LKKKVEIITFSGVDGAGKTTILREFTELLQNKYKKKVIEIRHRPSILPILSAIKYGKSVAEKKTMEVLPRTGANKSKVSSYVRFFYYLIDYVVGQWFVYFKYTRKDKIIIYDRYYFDFINDAKRANIDLESGFTSFFYKFIFEPELNVFLYASPDVILSRKQELDKESIVSLTKKYKALFYELGRKNTGQYLLIENLDKEKTMDLIEDAYLRVNL